MILTVARTRTATATPWHIFAKCLQDYRIMATAKDLIVKPIKAAVANEFVKSCHYSGKVVQNSQLHLGVFLGNMLHGVMQFGPSLDKRKVQGLVSGTKWHEFIELNRMAFTDALPRNSESRAIAVAM